MRKLFLLMLIFLCLLGCKKYRSYIYHIRIENQTDTPLYFNMFTIYGKNLDYYSNSTPFNGTSPKIFTVNPFETVILFSTETEISNPCLWFNEVFDSIYISLDSTLLLKFRPESVENYPYNLFNDKINWTMHTTEIPLNGNYRTLSYEVDIFHNFQINSYEIALNNRNSYKSEIIKTYLTDN